MVNSIILFDRWRSFVRVGVVLCLLMVVQSGRVEAAPLSEAEFKAATLSKIIPYVSWPRGNAPLVVGLFGRDPFSGRLHRLLKGQTTAGGRPIQVRVIKSTKEIPLCHVLYVPRAKMREWAQWSRGQAPRGQMTVGEETRFATEFGGICNLSYPSRKLEINRNNARRAGLKISSRLLKIATLVGK